MQGIDPCTSRMQSERSSIWATSPWKYYATSGPQYMPFVVRENLMPNRNMVNGPSEEDFWNPCRWPLFKMSVITGLLAQLVRAPC